MLPIVAELGLPSLSITYRNDFWAPKTEDCFYRYGQTEWQDLEAAVSYALEHGADDVVLVGYSYGGAIVTNFLYQSSLAGEVRGVILDAPMLDLNAIIQSAAGERNIPGPFLTSAGSSLCSVLSSSSPALSWRCARTRRSTRRGDLIHPAF